MLTQNNATVLVLILILMPIPTTLFVLPCLSITCWLSCRGVYVSSISLLTNERQQQKTQKGKNEMILRSRRRSRSRIKERRENCLYIYPKYIYAIVTIVTINHARTVCGNRERKIKEEENEKVGHYEKNENRNVYITNITNLLSS